MFKPALNITDQIADYLAEQIIIGELPGGCRIQEIKLSKSLGVSRGSIREALLILERRQLIEVVPRKGAQVNDLNTKDVLEVIDIMASLEIRMFSKLAQSAEKQAILQEAEVPLSGMEAAARAADALASVRERNDYYVAMLARSSRYLVAQFESVLPTSQRILHALMNHADVDQYDLARYYRALHNALLQGDCTRLGELVSAFARRAGSLAKDVFSHPPKPRDTVFEFAVVREPEVAVQ